MNKRKRSTKTSSSSAVDISEAPRSEPRFSKRNPKKQHQELHNAVNFLCSPPKHYWNRKVDLQAIGCSIECLVKPHLPNVLSRAIYNSDPDRIRFLLNHGATLNDMDDFFHGIFLGMINPSWPGDREYLTDLAVSIRMMYQNGAEIRYDVSRIFMRWGKFFSGNVIQDVICEFVWRFQTKLVPVDVLFS